VDTAVVQEFIVNAGVAGAVVLAMISGYLVPKFYVKKLEKEIDFLKEENRIKTDLNSDLTRTVANDNQLIGELRSLAHEQRRQGT
jgi:hypothetical protein